MTEMRVLTVRQPWAWAIVHGGKDVENRTRNIASSYRGPVAIHAGLTWDGSRRDKPQVIEAHKAARAVDGISLPERERRVMVPQSGHIIGVVDLVEVHTAHDCWGRSLRNAARLYRDDREAFDALPVMDGSGGLIARASICSPWAEHGVFHLVLANPRPLAEPIPFKGGLGLRRLDAATVDAVLAGVTA